MTAEKTTELSKRESIIAHCLEMNAIGLNQGTSGNISIRHMGGLLITPSGMPYKSMKPDDIVYVDADGKSHGQLPASSEWQFHRDVLQAKPRANAVVHTHAISCSTLAILGKEIPPLHYMVAVAGGHNIRCAPYATYGSQELSDHIIDALVDRKACLMAHHGMISIGTTLEQAMWLAIEVETLARQYHGCLQLGQEPPLLSKSQIQAVLAKISTYGQTEY